jgi:hypothetical protein
LVIINFFLSIAMAQWLVRAAVLHRLGWLWVRIPAKPNLI